MSDSMAYQKVFTPAAPISSRELLVGRAQELVDFHNAIVRPGFHPVVIGNRGVGKTSVVVLGLEAADCRRIRINCHPKMTFDELARAVLRDLGIDVDQTETARETQKSVEGRILPFGVGIQTRGEQKDISKRRGVGAVTLSPLTLFEHLRDHAEKVLLVVDEYDSVPPDSEVHTGIAYLMKNLSDHACESRIVVVGVARSAEALLGRHESIERNAREIYLNPLRRQDILDFVDLACLRTGLAFAQSVRDKIVWGSMGYPYFVHLVGLECLDAMLERDKDARCVGDQDFHRAIRRSVNQAYRSQLRKYRDRTRNLSLHERAVIREIVAADERQPLLRSQLQGGLVDGGIMTPQEFSHAWVRLQQEKHLVYVSRARDEVRFTDPLMAPFLRTWIFRERGHLERAERTDAQLEAFPVPDR